MKAVTLHRQRVQEAVGSMTESERRRRSIQLFALLEMFNAGVAAYDAELGRGASIAEAQVAGEAAYMYHHAAAKESGAFLLDEWEKIPKWFNRDAMAKHMEQLEITGTLLGVVLPRR
jgi:hypothetical protein